MASKGKRQFSARRHCGAKTRQGEFCSRGKGERTDHPGNGHCWLHEAHSRAGHYLQILRPGLRQVMEEILATNADLADLEPEVLLLRGIAIDYANRYDQFQEGIVAWHDSYRSAISILVSSNRADEIRDGILQLRESINTRPAQIPDIAAVSVLAERVARTVERIHKMKSESSISIATFKAITEEMGVIVARNADTETAKKIEDQWLEIKVSKR